MPGGIKSPCGPPATLHPAAPAHRDQRNRGTKATRHHVSPRDTIIQPAENTSVVVHEAPKTAGFGAEISATIQEHCFLHLEAPVQRVAGFDTVMPYYKLELEYLPDAPRIAEAVQQCAAY